MQISLDRLMHLVEQSLPAELAQWIADQGFDLELPQAVEDRGRLSLERALIELLAAGECRGRLSGIELFERRVRRIWESMLERYALEHALELYALELERREELLIRDDRSSSRPRQQEVAP